MRQLLLAFQFLTIIPIRLKGEIKEQEIARSALFFPLVGVFQGALAALAAFLLLKVFPAGISSALILLLLILSNGGFHLDGLADTFDALAVKATGNADRDRQKRLAVMKDSATGAIGVVALILTILLQFLLIRQLLTNPQPTRACFALFLMPLFSKWAMIPAIYHGQAVRKEGLGRIFFVQTPLATLLVSSLLLAVLYLLACRLFFGAFFSPASSGFLPIMLLVLYGFSLLSLKIYSRKFGGLTGDNLGAISETAEILFLLLAVLLLPYLF